MYTPAARALDELHSRLQDEAPPLFAGASDWDRIRAYHRMAVRVARVAEAMRTLARVYYRPEGDTL